MEYFEEIKQRNQSRMDCIEKSVNTKVDKSLSGDERKELIEKGESMPCGSFIIKNKEDLGKIIKSVGKRLDNHEAAKNWLIEKAQKLESEDLIPEGWDKIEKSMDKEQFLFKKTGKEVKEGVNNLLTYKEAEKQEYHKKIMDKITEIGFPPEKEIDDYYIKKYKHLLTYIPKRYCYSKMENESTPEEKRNCMEKYNMYARNYIEICINILKLKAVYKNIDENKKFTLNTEQLVTLGL